MEVSTLFTNPAFMLLISLSNNRILEGISSICRQRIYPLSFGEVALTLNVMAMKKNAVTGRGETAVYLAQLLVVQLKHE